MTEVVPEAGGCGGVGGWKEAELGGGVWDKHEDFIWSTL